MCSLCAILPQKGLNRISKPEGFLFGGPWHGLWKVGPLDQRIARVGAADVEGGSDLIQCEERSCKWIWFGCSGHVRVEFKKPALGGLGCWVWGRSAVADFHVDEVRAEPPHWGGCRPRLPLADLVAELPPCAVVAGDDWFSIQFLAVTARGVEGEVGASHAVWPFSLSSLAQTASFCSWV